MKKINKNSVLKATGAMIALTQATSALASVNVQTQTPSSSSRYTLTENGLADRPSGLQTGSSYSRYVMGASYIFANDPLVVLDETRTKRMGTTLDSTQTLDVMGGFEWNGLVSGHIAAPLHMVHRPNSANEFAPGDVRLFSKIYVLGRDSLVNVSLIPELRLPTGDKTLMLSDGGMSYGGSVAVEHDFGILSAAANLGYRRSSNAVYESMDYRQKVPVSLGLNIPVDSKWAINTEAAASLIVPFNKYHNPGEIYGGARYLISSGLVASAGASIGAVNGVSSSDVRLQAGLQFSPFSETALAVVKPIVQTKALPAPRVVFTPKKIEISEEVKFEHDSDVLTDSGKNLLDEVAAVMKQNRAGFKRISIEGHTNELGSDSYNLGLSKRRAASVKEYLASRGIEQNALNTAGYGERKPKLEYAGKLSRDAWLATNRRVEFMVVKP